MFLDLLPFLLGISLFTLPIIAFIPINGYCGPVIDPASLHCWQTQFLVVLALLTAFFALLGIGLYATPIQDPVKKPLLITGWLHVKDSTVPDVILVVELEENFCTHSEILPNGRFYFEIPVDAKARLVFNKPGYLTKEVVIDTRNALNNKEATKVNSKVKFDIVLESTEITTPVR